MAKERKHIFFFSFLKKKKWNILFDALVKGMCNVRKLSSLEKKEKKRKDDGKK
jgi:hypothetical protein